MENIRINSDMLAESLQLNSLEKYSKAGGLNPQETLARAIGNWGNDSTAKLKAITNKYLGDVDMFESMMMASEEKGKVYSNFINGRLETASKDLSRNPERFAMLPEDVKAFLNPIKTQIAEATRLIKSAKNATERFKHKYIYEKAQACFENTLFGILNQTNSNSYNMFESYTYQNAILFQKMESEVQFAQCAAAIYSKVIRTKMLADEKTTVVVPTQEMILIATDEYGQPVREWKREDIFSHVDPTSIAETDEEKVLLEKIFSPMRRKVKLTKDFLNKPIDLRSTKCVDAGNGQMVSIITGQEVVRSDFWIKNVKIGAKTVSKLTDIRSGRIITETMSEPDYKGKVFQLMLDPKKPEDLNFISVDFDGPTQKLLITSSKSGAAEDIEEFEIEFKLLDINNTFKTNVEFTVRERMSQINAGEVIKLEIPKYESELTSLRTKLSADYLSKIMSLATQTVVNYKDTVFFRNYFDAKEDLIRDIQNTSLKRHVLYTKASVDLNLQAEAYKTNALNLQLGNIFKNLNTRFNVASNTGADSLVNIFCSTYHLDVINSVLSPITGTVGADNNGQFLGVVQNARTNTVTIGTDTSAPVSAIVVGTDKSGLEAKVYDSSNQPIAPGDIEYKYHILASFNENNLMTQCFVETANRIVSDPALRSPIHQLIPVTNIYASGYMKVFRGCMADLTIKGWLNPVVG